VPRWPRPTSREPPGSEERTLLSHRRLIQPLSLATSVLTSFPQCDEAHPTCRNCQKSKRECLGYDPIFKQQPGPPQIQPAPNSTPHQASLPASSPPISAPYTQVPQGYAPAVTAGYVPPVSSSQTNHTGNANFDNNSIGSAIDPALAGQDPAMHGGQPPYNSAHALNPMLRGVGSASPYSSAASETPVIKGRLQFRSL
jgi:hypothetical protein